MTDRTNTAVELGLKVNLSLERLKQTKEENEALRDHVLILEDLEATTDGKNLPEVLDALLKLNAAEIEKRSKDSAIKLHNKWEKNERPKQVMEEAASFLKQTLSIINSGSSDFGKDLHRWEFQTW